MKEIFKTIPGFENYQVSNFGNVKSLKRYATYFNSKSQKFIKYLILEKILKSSICNRGYYHITLCRNNNRYPRKVSDLVLTTFISKRPKGKEISHLNGNCLDDNLNNLKWETHEENIKRRNSKGEKNNNAKLTNDQVIEIRKLLQQSYTQGYIAGMFNVYQGTISKIKNNRNWRQD